MPLAFNANRHEYTDLDLEEVVPHITGMLEETGWIDARWFTEESCERGQAVHRLTADYDLGAIEDPSAVTSLYKGWLLAHVQAMEIIVPTWVHIEEPLISEVDHFGGRPDRVGVAYGAECVLEIKSGAVQRVHGIQTALQAILVAPELRIPPEHINRYALYLSGNGRWKLERFVDRHDFWDARAIIRQCCVVRP